MEIVGKILAYVKQETKLENINAGSLLLESKIIDSLQLIQLIAFLEREFSISIKDDELNSNNFESINVIAALVKKDMNNVK